MSVKASTDNSSMNKTVGWGFIGTSNIAKQWMAAAVRHQPGHEVVAIMSHSLSRAQMYAQDLKIANAYDSFTALLADPAVEVVYISNTNEQHKPAVLAAAKAGKHVFCEKPLALNLADAAEMVSACKQAGVVMATNHHLRNAATHQAIRAEIAAGTVGQVIGVRIFHAIHLPQPLQTWRVNDPKAGGGVVLDVAVHDADVIRYLLAEDPVDVMAYAQTGGMASAVEDGAMTILQMPSGALVQTHESFMVPYAGTGLEVHGTKGSIVARDILTQRPAGTVEVITETGRRQLDIQHHNLYHYSLAQFAQAIAGNGQPAVTGEDGLKSLAIALAMLQSAEQGQRVTIDYPAVYAQ
ncbi:Gfo/Idh/MocA family protein [Spartinivicinus poritis]|uniref:Gfo/Idh/MocA family oxidoreductase n=1 Tax=Spartinivicinus poritis TaxID=2994640 RepID=A0ABT5UAS8_9GAMM|nr:Gfo/Idh/MocA family oxidoreductase [Spartinivicinus sp. A2-2]MDE1463479.1 Gfo/Idh/MocA family oxidoreductase [Spartinivicinus sp. A2-2]